MVWNQLICVGVDGFLDLFSSVVYFRYQLPSNKNCQKSETSVRGGMDEIIVTGMAERNEILGRDEMVTDGKVIAETCVIQGIADGDHAVEASALDVHGTCEWMDVCVIAIILCSK